MIGSIRGILQETKRESVSVCHQSTQCRKGVRITASRNVNDRVWQVHWYYEVRARMNSLHFDNSPGVPTTTEANCAD